jgi:hypothetical protein
MRSTSPGVERQSVFFWLAGSLWLPPCGAAIKSNDSERKKRRLPAGLDVNKNQPKPKSVSDLGGVSFDVHAKPYRAHRHA